MKTEPKQFSVFSVISGNKDDITGEKKISKRFNDHFVSPGEKLALGIPGSSSL